jgi:hypothetical protein
MPLIRVTNISGSTPTTSQLGIGDIVVNTYDGKAYIKKQVGLTQTVVPLGDGASSVSASYALSSSYSFASTSASYALTSSYALNSIPAFPYTGSALITGSLGITGSLSSTSNVLFTGLINQTTPQNFVVTFNNTTGQLYITASSAFGGGGGGGSTPGGPYNSVQYNNAGVLDGSSAFNYNGTTVKITGSLIVSGSTSFTGSVASLNGFTGSLFGTSSWARSASWAPDTTFPYTGSALITGSLGVTGSVSITKSGSTVFSIDGSSGQLFSVTDSLSGSLFSVNTVAGLPVIEAFSDNIVNIGKYGAYGLTVSGSVVRATGSFTGSFTGSLLGTASWAANAITASYALLALTASFARTASYINPLFQAVFISGSTEITGSTTVRGNFTVNSATTVDLNTNVLNINAPLITVPTFATPYSPSANVRTVLYDAISNALFVTSSLPGTGGGGNATYIATGSITASVNIGLPNFFLLQSGSQDIFKIDTNKVVVIATQSSAPTAVIGGIFVSSSGDFFFGI